MAILTIILIITIIVVVIIIIIIIVHHHHHHSLSYIGIIIIISIIITIIMITIIVITMTNIIIIIIIINLHGLDGGFWPACCGALSGLECWAITGSASWWMVLWAANRCFRCSILTVGKQQKIGDSKQIKIHYNTIISCTHAN